jgi:hypothetical protein
MLGMGCFNRWLGDEAGIGGGALEQAIAQSATATARTRPRAGRVI